MEQIGIVIPRIQEKVIEEGDYILLTLPHQSTANAKQIILSKEVNVTPKFYNGCIIRTQTGEIRQIVEYLGKSRICQLDKELLVGKSEGDMIELYKNTHTAMAFNENTRQFEMGKCNNRHFLNEITLGDLSINNINVKNAIQSSSITTDGDLSVNNNVKVNNELVVMGNTCLSKIKLGKDTSLLDKKMTMGDYHISATESDLTFQKDTKFLLGISENKLSLEQNTWISNASSIGYLSISGDNTNANYIKLSSDGEITLNTQQQFTITSKKTHIVSDCEIQGTTVMNGTAIVNGDFHIQNDLQLNNVTVSGTLHCDALTQTPEIKTRHLIGGEIIAIDNVDLLNINKYCLLTFTVDILPVSEENPVEFLFELPNITKNFEKRTSAVIHASGQYEENEKTRNILDLVAYTITNTKQVSIEFTSNSAVIHTISIWCKYTI